MKSKKEYEMQRKRAREWSILYLDYAGIEPTEKNIREYAFARRRILKQFHRLRGHLLG